MGSPWDTNVDKHHPYPTRPWKERDHEREAAYRRTNGLAELTASTHASKWMLSNSHRVQVTSFQRKIAPQNVTKQP